MTLDVARMLAADARLVELSCRGDIGNRTDALERWLEDGMGDEGGGHVPVKLPPELLARADALIAAVGADRELGTLAGGRVSRAAVVRLALLYGLDELERRMELRRERE